MFDQSVTTNLIMSLNYTSYTMANVIQVKDCLSQYLLTHVGVENGSVCQDDNDSNTGLWLDVLAFACATLQLIILDTSYAEQVKERLIRKEEDAQKLVN